jgi:hypothetical protein
MGSYFISPPRQTSWTFDVEELTHALRGAWPKVEVERISDPKSVHCLRWTIEGEFPGPVEGTLAKNGNTIHLDGDLRGAVAVALWVRTIAPAHAELIFYDEGYTADVQVTSQSTEDDLASPFLAGA